MEWYTPKGVFVNKDDWVAEIHHLRDLVRTTLDDEQSLDALKTAWFAAFERAILSRVAEHKNATNATLGVLFSGGVDSAFIAYVLAQHKIPFTCYTVGFKDPLTKEPEDILFAREVVAYFGWRHKERVLDLDELRPLVAETTRLLGDVANPVTVGVGTVVVAAAKLAMEDGCVVLFGGLGSEEIFAGYHRHDKAQSRDGGVHEESWNGLLRMYERDMIRDARIAAGLGITVLTPFMDADVITLAMQMPDEVKIVGEHKKYVLRVIAESRGLPREFAFRPKRAAQYGSRMHKTIDRLAARAGMTQEDYISSLL